MPGSLQVVMEESIVVVTLFEECVDGEVRLEGGNNPMQGRVQMCYNGVFGSVCDTGTWSVREAEVVCTQLGYVALPGNSTINLTSWVPFDKIVFRSG